MLRYLIKRILLATGVLFAVSLLMFFISTLAPGDLAESYIGMESSVAGYQYQPYSVRTREYSLATKRLGRDLPPFYFSISPRIVPDTLHRILRRDERNAFRSLLLIHGDRPLVNDYRKNILGSILHLESIKTDWAKAAAGNIEYLLTTTDTGRVRYVLNELVSSIPVDDTTSLSYASRLRNSYSELSISRLHFGNLLPTVHWYGFKNQYQNWIGRTLRGDLGRSLIDGRPVNTKITEALKWTLTINLVAIILAFVISIPLGVYSAGKVGTVNDKFISSILFAFYAMPGFWLAMLCIVFLTTSEYAGWLDWFPTGGVGRVTDGMSVWEKAGIRISHLTLPVFCVLAGSLAYLTRQMRGSTLRELKQDYVRLASTKGIGARRILWHHAARNALFPMITLVGSAIPAAVSGSVILEVIFSIPGMGRLLFMSIQANDWPVVYAMVMLAACLTVVGYFIADLLYRWTDPRVTFESQRS